VDEYYIVQAYEDGIPVVATLSSTGIGAGIDASEDINTIITRLTEIRDGSGGGLTQGETTTAVENALTANANVESIKTAASSINDKIPAVAAMADAAANPTLSRIGALLQAFNGTGWDRLRAGISGAVSSVLGYLNVVGVLKYNTTLPTLTNGQWVELQGDINGRLLTSERVVSYSIGSTQTSATGSSWVALASGATRNITIRNRTGTSIDIRPVGSSDFFTMADGDTETYPVNANSNEWEIKRSDNSNTQVVVKFFRYA
jgi:hypothetical protein